MPLPARHSLFWMDKTNPEFLYRWPVSGGADGTIGNVISFKSRNFRVLTAPSHSATPPSLPGFLLFALLLAGCSHSLDCAAGRWHDDCEPGTKAYIEKQKADAETAAANDAADDAKCKAYNLVPDTPAYIKCRDQLADKRDQTTYDDRAALARRLQGHFPGN